MKIGIYVGSFNPVHMGHIKIVNHLLETSLDKVIIVATGNYWNKKNLMNVNKRIKMLKYFENDKIIIDEEHNNLPYTYLVMNQMKKKYPKDTLYLILGADNLIHFEKWKEYKTLLKYNFILIRRDNIDLHHHLKKLKKEDGYIEVKSLPNLDISSTMIRTCIQKKEYDKLEGKIDHRVLTHIMENGYYV